ncbi:glycosyltransferase [Hyunsoonleella sp. 2307UL5-6]|uniref:glycosyltransferase n=1 Tax=Hyunsoonleella sp. 2307UL5-6 TaxID=3384768 RepID=UPI0039BC5513
MSKKICLLVSSLSSGGAEKVAANLSIALEKRGYSITIVSMQNHITYNYSGRLYNFGVVKEEFGKLKAFVKFIKFFKQNEFDCVIDHRLRDVYLKELVFSKIVFKHLNVIYCIHNYHLHYYFSFLNIIWLAKLPHVKRGSFVTVSNSIRDRLYKKLSITGKTIYNFIDTTQLLKYSHSISTDNSYIIGIGRLTDVKQFDVLIECYQQSKLPKQNIKLFIVGDGPEQSKLKGLINNSEFKNRIKIMPFTNEPYPLIQNAKALVLSSKFEGFPMVLLEALNLGTPLIAYNCNSGPNEIIKHNLNGILVENQNKKALVAALNRLLDDAFYNKIKANTSLGLEIFSEEAIIQEWETTFVNHK